MPTYTVTADDLQWYARCGRAWDLGALARHGLEPAPPAAADPLVTGLRDALAVHYFPGMWAWDRAIVSPLVVKAYEQGGGTEEGRRLLTGFQRWSPTADQFTPLRVQFDLDVAVPDPADPDRHLADLDGRRVRYRERVDLAMESDDGRRWLVQHRVVPEFAHRDELLLDERGVLACWAWDETELALPIAGTQYTELRTDPPGVKRTEIARSPAVLADAAARLGRSVLAMLAAAPDPDPTPEWSHCRRCAFRPPCLLMQKGDDDAAVTLLASDYRDRPPDDLEEGRLGGTSWGLGRGAAPRRF